MDVLIPLFSIAVVVAAGLAGIAIWAPRAFRIKLVALGMTAVLLPLVYLSLAELLGRPKPVAFEWNPIAFTEANVVAADLREGEAIYLWLRVDGADAPRAYALPWNLNTARQLYAAQQAAEVHGTPVRVRRIGSSEPDDESEPMFYAAPQPRAPSKS